MRSIQFVAIAAWIAYVCASPLTAQAPQSPPASISVSWDELIADFSEPVATGQLYLNLNPKLVDKYGKATIELSGPLKAGINKIFFTIGVPSKTVQPKGHTIPFVVDEVTVQPLREELARWQALKPGAAIRFRAKTFPTTLFNVLTFPGIYLNIPPTEAQKTQPSVIVVLLTDATLLSPE